MQKFIAQQNIKLFRRILQGPLTDKERQTVLRLLQNEEERLARITASSSAEDDK